MVDNNIVQSLGAGSGIDTKNLVKQLVEIERSAPQQRIDTKRELRETQISDFGKIKSALSTFQASAAALIKPEGLFSKSASFTDSNVIVPTSLDTKVAPGTYKFTVDTLAQSQTLASGEYTSVDDAVGTGTITFNFGAWDGATFNTNGGSPAVPIVIDSSNNSLKGLKEAINDAKMGVTASIVNNGSGYVLSINAQAGLNHQLKIDVDEGATAPENTDSIGLSRFAYDAAIAGFTTQKQIGTDADLTVNGLSVTRSSNTITDLVEGLTLDLLKSAPGETVSITVSDDKTFAKQTTRDFVDAYNALLTELEPVIGFDKENDKRGSLSNDALAKSIVGQMRNIFASGVPGMSENAVFTALTNLGIRTELDGTLTIKDEEFDKAFSDRFEDIQKMLAPAKASSNSGILVNSFGKQTEAGEYDVQITTHPRRGYFTGDQVVAGFPLDSTGKDYSFNLNVNGVATNLITLPADAIYANETELAGAMQSAINGDTHLKEVSTTVTVAFTNGAFVITSGKYGSASKIDVASSTGDAIDDLKLAAGNGVAGVDVAGTINGVAGFGTGQVLLPKLGEKAEGLTMIVSEFADSGTVNFSRGVSGQIDTLINNFLQSNGLISERVTNLTRDVTEATDKEKQLDRRMTAYHERLMSQFIAMESIINGMNGSGDFLDNLFSNLPFTSKNR
ncbi:MAG: flagellar filament capping protein FliD [Marinagarivorans sp.]|nr:flagellar filament capping protein FliD [Marinagarivorans sp.]